jgi:predicted SPOUT superfamily RNA methylase MTH1
VNQIALHLCKEKSMFCIRAGLSQEVHSENLKDSGRDIQSWIENDARLFVTIRLVLRTHNSSTMKLSKNETYFGYALFAISVQIAYTAKEHATDFVAKLRGLPEPSTVDEA